MPKKQKSLNPQPEFSEISENLDNDEVIKEKISEIAENTKELKDEKQERKPKTKKYISKKDVAEKQKAVVESGAFAMSKALEIIVSRIDKEQPLVEVEKEMFNDAFKTFFEKYADFEFKYKEEMVLLSVLAVIIIPRLDIKKLLKKENGKQTNNNFRENGNGKISVSNPVITDRTEGDNT